LIAWQSLRASPSMRQGALWRRPGQRSPRVTQLVLYQDFAARQFTTTEKP
jgi:hypothetical protein